MNAYKVGFREKYIIFSSVLFLLLAQPFRFFRLSIGVDVSGYVLVLAMYLMCFLVFIILYGFKNNHTIISKLSFLFLILFSMALNVGDLKYNFILIGAFSLYVAQTTFFDGMKAREPIFLAIFLSLGLYSLVVFLLVLAAILGSSGIGNVLQALIDPITYLHRPDSDLYLLYNHIRFEKVFLGRGPREYVYDGVQLALYPYFYCLLYIIAPRYSKNLWATICMLLAVFVVLCFNSRAMILSLIYLSVYVTVLRKNKILTIFNNVILLVMVFFPVGLYVLLSDEMLRGRGKVYDLVIANGVKAFGHGVGKATAHLTDLTGFLGSFHNIHLEFIYDFGYIAYSFILLFVINRIISGVDKYYVTFVVFVFFYMSTNGNLVDYYFVYFSILFLYMSHNDTTYKSRSR
jgi:hypothetical protein